MHNGKRTPTSKHTANGGSATPPNAVGVHACLLYGAMCEAIAEGQKTPSCARLPSQRVCLLYTSPSPRD
eukprot:9722280-Alexandrium_andersonii.AAC.1